MRVLVADVISNGRDQNCAEILRGIRQRGVRTGGDALHTLGAIFRDINRRLAASHIFALRGATARAHHAQAGKSPGRLVVTQFVAELGIKFLHRLERRTFLFFGHGAAGAAAGVAAGGAWHFDIGRSVRGEHRVAHARGVGVFNFAVLDFHHALEAAEHHFHIRLHDSLAEAAKFFLVLIVHDLVVLLLAEVVILEKTGDAEKRAEEGVALHTQLEIRAAGGIAGDIETGQNEHANVVLFNKGAMMGGDALPRGLGRFTRFPNKAAAFVDTLKRIAVREGFGIATEHHIHVI